MDLSNSPQGTSAYLRQNNRHQRRLSDINGFVRAMRVVGERQERLKTHRLGKTDRRLVVNLIKPEGE